MPIGVIVNTLAIAIGGFIGAKYGSGIPAMLKEKLNLLFGICAMGIGVTSIIQMQNLSAVVLALILGAVIGMLIRLSERIEKGCLRLSRLFSRGKEQADNDLLVTALVLFCSSGTGIYGSIVSGMNGEHNVLIAKSILDLFTAMIFACTLGSIVAAIAIPQFLVFIALFVCAKLIFPLTTPTMVNDFKACSGLIMLATGFRIAKIKDFPIADMIPAMLLIWPISYAWTTYIMPLL